MAKWQVCLVYSNVGPDGWFDISAGDGVRLVIEEGTAKVAELLTANLHGSTCAQMAGNMRKDYHEHL